MVGSAWCILFCGCKILTTATGFVSDLAESKRGADAPLAQGEISIGAEVRSCMSRRGLWVAGWHHVKLPRSNPERRQRSGGQSGHPPDNNLSEQNHKKCEYDPALNL